MTNGGGKVVCVTGAGGFVASWLVKLLLSQGYTVHGTVRDPSDEKNAHLGRLENATENLKLFKADLLDYRALLAAIDGCEGVFHTACPVPYGQVLDPQNEIVAPAVDGTLNVLKACSEAKVRRVIVVSSMGAVILNPRWPDDKIMDEDSWSDEETCKMVKNWYCLSKKIAEEKALNYAKESGLDLITVCPCMIVGPMLQSTVNSTSLYLIKILKGLHDSVENRFQHLVDVRDVADALLLAYEKLDATGRYISCSHTIKTWDFIDKLRSMYPSFKYVKNFTEVQLDPKLSSDKLKQLGWKHRALEETITDTVEQYLKAGLLDE